MWAIKHPSIVFNYITSVPTMPYIKALMLKDKFYKFPIDIRNIIKNKCNFHNVKICDPNNPANLLDAILIEYIFK